MKIITIKALGKIREDFSCFPYISLKHMSLRAGPFLATLAKFEQTW